jgi:spermidine/putrescine transport system permease protein
MRFEMNFMNIVRSAFTPSRPVKIGEAQRHAKLAYARRFSFSNTVFFVTLVFLFMPLFVLVFYSFNSSTSMNWTGFSLRWYQRLLTERGLWTAFSNSIIIALTSAATATVIGTIGAIGVNWYRFKLLSCR